MTEPTCPWCRERDARIAELERLLAAAGPGAALVAGEAHPAPGDGDGRARHRLRRRVRLSPEEEDRRRRRKEAGAVLRRYAIGAGAALFAILLIWALFFLLVDAVQH